MTPEPASPGRADCYADLDGDGQVGIFEFLLVLASWGPCDDNCGADFDHDSRDRATQV